MIKPFYFKIAKPKAPTPQSLDRVTIAPEKETFVGQIQGMKASDLEERFARALDKQKVGYEFRKAYFASRGQLGEVELDFLISNGGQQIPVQIDGSYAHKSEQQHRHDDQQDALLNYELSKQGGTVPVKRITANYLGSQEEADRVVKELL